MAERRLSEYTALITWLGRVPLDRPNIRSQAVETIFASYAGFENDYHGGLTRAACMRVGPQHPKGTEIRNTRQLSILSVEEMAQIATTLDVPHLDPALLGASLILSGIPDFTFVPPGSLLQAPNGTTISIDVENGPCNFPAQQIEQDAPGHGKAFRAAAQGKRGVTAWIEREGQLSVGDILTLHIPNQRQWNLH